MHRPNCPTMFLAKYQRRFLTVYHYAHHSESTGTLAQGGAPLCVLAEAAAQQIALFYGPPDGWPHHLPRAHAARLSALDRECRSGTASPAHMLTDHTPTAIPAHRGRETCEAVWGAFQGQSLSLHCCNSHKVFRNHCQHGYAPIGKRNA